jgi:hypothetical protein
MVDEFINQRVAKFFKGCIYFGTVVERTRGPVTAAGADGMKVLQAVWKIVYDDADTEQLTRIEIMDLMRTYRLHEQEDIKKSNGVGSLVEVPLDDDVDGVNEADFEDGLVSTDCKFLDPRYNLLDMLTPTARQNRLSYLVELVLDKCQKGISNEAVKLRIRKDAAAFGAENLPTDVRGIGRYLGARSLQEVTRHRCSNDECSFAWSGAVDPKDFDINDTCPECGTHRYKREGRKIKPRRVFYYLGAANAIEALHRNAVFKAN